MQNKLPSTISTGPLDQLINSAPTPAEVAAMRDFMSMNRKRRRSIIAAMKREAKRNG